MSLSKHSKYISAGVAIISIILLFSIYYITGDWVIMIMFIPPITHWILEKREEKKNNHG